MIKGPAVSGAIANTSQIMNHAQIDLMQIQNNILGLNSSQPIILNKGHSHNLELNTNLRQINKNRTHINDSLNQQ